ncbi:MFS transporter [Streptomyces sp. S3(2020)]|uniref:MFS transporter n=1 Tax=Streptomyces sp. S3(2020) TaxID=2732044 RepID=UPI001487D9E8|nr:MFS transporter [Streptomyces sp. S3(2020)]NNN32871.1 MFS transporter [Streptomyces sp. S3(2020)]
MSTQALRVERRLLPERGTVALVYAAGVTAGMALGRFIPLSSDIRDHFGLSLAAFGWLVSGITVVGAVAALPAGLWIARGDLGRVLSAGLAVMLAGGVLEVVSPSAPLLYAARALEGCGYLLVVITGPLVLSARCGPGTERGALALWSTFIPVGMALASAAGTFTGVLGWRLTAALTVIPAVLPLVGALAWLTGTTSGGARRQAEPSGGLGPVLWLSVSFSLIALLGVTAIALLPDLADHRDISATLGSATTAAVSLASVPGGLTAGLLMHRGLAPRQLALGTLAMPLAAVVIYQTAPWAAITAGAAVLMAANGLVLAALYASMPTLAHSPHALRRGYGLLNQAGCLGSLFGPPVFGFAITHTGWTAATVLVALVSLAGLALFWTAARTAAAPG